MRVKKIIGIVLILLVSVGIIFLLRQSKQPPLATLLQQIPSPTPFPFRELTIPYLREKSYHSRLSHLQLAYENAGYTAYLTSYDSDGLRINGLLTQPKGQQPASGWPAIVFIHGYIPPKQYQTLERYVAYVDYLARHGFVVFKIDLRGHGDSEGQPSGAYYASGYVIDALNAYAALQSTAFVNSKKIGLWGHSMAGNIVLRSLVVKRDIPAAVIWAGAGYTYQDLLDYRLRDSSFVPQSSTTRSPQSRQRLLNIVGPIADNSPFWQQFIPTHYLTDLNGALEIHHAVDDNVVSIAYSRNLNQLLDKTSVPHEYYEYPSGGHNLDGNSFTIAMQRTVEFFKQYLAGF